MKNFKKYLVLALSFGLSLSSLNAGIVEDFNKGLQLGRDASNRAEFLTAKNYTLTLVNDLEKHYQNKRHLFARYADQFQTVFGESIAEAQANARGEGRVGLERELEEAAALIDEAQTRATQAERSGIEAQRHILNLRGNLDATEEGRQALERQLRQEQRERAEHQKEVAKINEEARKTKLDLLRLQEQMQERKKAERQAQENQNVASSSTEDVAARLENLVAENNALNDEMGTLQEEHDATLQQLQACQARNAELTETVHQQARTIRGLEKVANALGKK